MSRIKIKGRLSLYHGNEITPSIKKQFRQEIFEYITEVEIGNSELEIFSPSDKEEEEIESNWLTKKIALHKEPDNLDSTLLLPETDVSLDQSCPMFPYVEIIRLFWWEFLNCRLLDLHLICK